MARRRAVEADEFFETANRLQAEGKEVTATTMLDALGGGSLRTIYKHLEIWQEQRPTLVATTPEEIPGSVQVAFASAWRLATQEAGRVVLAVKEKAAAEVQAAQDQFQGALDAIEKLESESEADAIRIEELTAKLFEKEELVHLAQADAAGHRAAAEQLQKLVEKQEKDLERLRAEGIQEREKHQEAQQNTNATIELLRESLKNAQANADKFERESHENRNLRDQANQAKNKAEEASKADRAAREAAIKEAAEQKGKAEALKAQNAELLALVGDIEKKKGQ